MKAAPSTNTRSSIRRTAVTAAITLGLLSMVFSLGAGKPAGRILLDGLAVAVQAGLTWMVYHLLTRQNNGIGIMGLAFASPDIRSAVSGPVNWPKLLFVSVFAGAFLALTCWGIDAVEKWKNRKKSAKSGDPALFDATLDGSPPN